MPRVAALALNKHQQKTEATRRKLLKSGQRIFARDGFEAARIEDIARDGGHTRGAFYANFESKEALFFALLEQQVAEHIQNIQRLLELCSTDAERYKALRDYYVRRLGDRQWTLLTLEFKLYAIRHPKLRPKLLKIHRELRASAANWKKGTLRDLFPSAGVHCHPEEGLRRALEATLHGLVLENAYDPAAISEGQAETFLGEIFDSLISTPTAAK